MLEGVGRGLNLLRKPIEASEEGAVSVCFVCLGNICRSPTAEGVFRKLVKRAGLEARIHIDSAGTSAAHAGDLADPRSRATALGYGVTLESRSRPVRDVDFETFDLLVAMDASNRAALESRRRPTDVAQIALLRDFDPSAPLGQSVPDPYYGGDTGFDRVFYMVARACEGLLQELCVDVLQLPRPSWLPDSLTRDAPPQR